MSETNDTVVLDAPVPPTEETASATLPPPPAPSIKSAIAGTQKSSLGGPPKGLRDFNTADLGDVEKMPAYFRVLLYGEPDSWKTVVAARFDSPENTLIVLTRRPEQTLPLINLGYEVVCVSDEASLVYALDSIGKLWKKKQERNSTLGELHTLVVDDLTEAVNLLKDEYKEIDGKVVKNLMRTYYAAGDTLRDLVSIGIFRLPLNVVCTALARSKESKMPPWRETVTPDLPPSMLNAMSADFDGVFHIVRDSHQILTREERNTAKYTDPATGKEETATYSIFAKIKHPIDSKTVASKEPPDLRLIWNKILAGRVAATPAAKPILPASGTQGKPGGTLPLGKPSPLKK